MQGVRVPSSLSPISASSNDTKACGDADLDVIRTQFTVNPFDALHRAARFVSGLAMQCAVCAIQHIPRSWFISFELFRTITATVSIYNGYLFDM